MKVSICSAVFVFALVGAYGAQFSFNICPSSLCTCTPPNVESSHVIQEEFYNGEICLCFCGRSAGESCRGLGECAKCLECMAGCDSPAASIGVCQEKVKYYPCGQYQTAKCGNDTNYEVQCFDKEYQCSETYINGFWGRNSQGQEEEFMNECQFYMRNLEVEDKFRRIQ